MKKIPLTIVLLLLAFSINAKKYDPPKLTAVEAIHAANDYVDKNKVILGEAYFISEVIYLNMYDEYHAAYWKVKWHSNPRVKGGWFEIRVFNDGKIEPHFGE